MSPHIGEPQAAVVAEGDVPSARHGAPSQLVGHRRRPGRTDELEGVIVVAPERIEEENAVPDVDPAD